MARESSRVFASARETSERSCRVQGVESWGVEVLIRDGVTGNVSSGAFLVSLDSDFLF